MFVSLNLSKATRKQQKKEDNHMHFFMDLITNDHLRVQHKIFLRASLSLPVIFLDTQYLDESATHHREKGINELVTQSYYLLL